jgi:hypothetical protein
MLFAARSTKSGPGRVSGSEVPRRQEEDGMHAALFGIECEVGLNRQNWK